MQPWTPQPINWANPWQMPAQPPAQQPYMPMIWKGEQPTAPAAQPTWRQPIDWAKPWGIPEQYREQPQGLRALSEEEIRWQAEAEDSSIISDPATYWGQPTDYAQLPRVPDKYQPPTSPWEQPIDWREPFWIPPASAEALQKRVFQRYGLTTGAQRILAEVPINVKNIMARTGGGLYYPTEQKIELETAADEAAIHEMAHAWSESNAVGLFDPSSFMAVDPEFRKAIQRLAEETDPRYVRAARLAYMYEHGHGVWPGMGEDDSERFAGLASGVMGDISQLPPYVRKFYEGLFTGEAPPAPDQPTPWTPAPMRPKIADEERERAAAAWLPMIRKQWPGAVAPPGVLPEYFYQEPAPTGDTKWPWEESEKVAQAARAVEAWRGMVGPQMERTRALQDWSKAKRAQEAFDEGRGPAPTPEQVATLRVGMPEAQEPLEAIATVGLPAASLVKAGLDITFAPIPEFIKDPVAEAGLGVLSFFGKFAPAAKRGLSVVNFELMKRTSPDWGLTMPWATEEDLEIRRNTFALVREIDVTPAQANQLGTSHWTWTAHPDRLEKALEEVKAGADPLEVAEKHRDNTAEFFGELFIDPLNCAGVVTKPIAKVLRSSIQSAKKFPGISKAFQLTNRSIANVAWADTVDIGRVLTENLDSADDAARAIDNFIANPAKVADNFLPRAKQQSESVAELLAGVKGKNIVGKTLDSEQAARKMADISYRAAQKATGMAVGGDKHLYNTAQRFLMEHWLGTRPGWVVFNGIDNSAKLAIEGVNPFQRIGLVHDSVVERYGKSFIPTEVIEGGLGKSVQGDGKLLHQKIFGPLAKPMELNFKASGVLESGGRLRIYLNKSLGKIRGSRDDMIGMLDDLLGPNVDDITKANIAQDLRSVQYPNEATTKAVFDRYLRKKSPAATMSSFPGDQGFISQEMRDYLGPMFQKAKTPEEVAEIVAKADAGLLEEIAQWGQDVGGPGSPFPATHYAERGGVGAIFEEDGWKLMPQRPDLSHEIVGELAHKVNINPKHAQNALNKIGRELGLETPKGGWTWANLRAASNGEGARLYHNYLVELASTRDVELPSWFTHVDLLEEKMPFLGAEDLSVRPKEAAMLPGIEAEAEIAAGRPQEIADYMREATEQGLGIGPEEIDAAQAAAIPPAFFLGHFQILQFRIERMPVVDKGHEEMGCSRIIDSLFHTC